MAKAPASIDEYLAAIPARQRAALEKVRRAVRAAAPEAVEAISYQMPAFKERGRILVYFAAFKDHCSFFPASGAVMEELGDELEPYFAGKGTLRFTVERPIPARLVRKIVKLRRAEIEAARRR